MKKNLSLILLSSIFFCCLSACCNNNQQVKSKVKPGIEVLRDQNFSILKGKRVGLITNHTTLPLKANFAVVYKSTSLNTKKLASPKYNFM